MSFFGKLFSKPAKPSPMSEELREIGNRLIIKGYRKIAAQYNCAPTAKTSDKEILTIQILVSGIFDGAAERRGERIPALFMNYIVLKFFQVFELRGMEGLASHLEYESKKYSAEGLRPDYRQELPLFDPNGNDPDVKRLSEIHNLAKRML